MPDAEGRLFSDRLQLLLVTWDGTYQGVSARWLRWAPLDGDLLPTPQEVAERAEERAAQAELEAERAQREADTVRQRAAEPERLPAEYRRRLDDGQN